MPMKPYQSEAAKLAEIRCMSKDVREIKELLKDIKEILMMNTYGDCKEGVQMTLDDICKRIVDDAKLDTECKEFTAADRIGHIMKEAFDG